MTGEKITDLSPTVTVCQRCSVMIPDGDYNVCSECARQLLGIANRLNRERIESRQTLRDQFAMAAMAGMVTEQAERMLSDRTRKTAAELAYQVADAMLAEREKGGEA